MTTFSQRTFAGGEIAPTLYSRTDIVKYFTGLRVCRNMIILKPGGAANRAGLSFIGEVKDSSKTVRLIPFVFNSEQTYMLEFGDQYMRVIRNGDYQKESAQNITAITNADPAVVTINSHGYSNGDEVYISSVGGMTELNGRNFKVANVTTNTFELTDLGDNDIDSTGYGTYSSGGTAEKIYEVSTSYVEADLPTLQYFQSADVITLTHPSYAPSELSRSGHTSWSFSSITFEPSIDPPSSGFSVSTGSGTAVFWKVTSVKQETFEESEASSSVGGNTFPTSTSPVTLSWSTVSGAEEYNVFRRTDGIYAFVGKSAGSGTSSFTDYGIISDLSDTPPIVFNPFSGSNNYPSTGSYIQQRRWFANTNNNPETCYGSAVGLYTNYYKIRPIQDDSPVTFTTAGNQVQRIKHLLDLGRMVILTDNGEFSAIGDSVGFVTPTAVNLKQHGYNGSSDLKPLVINTTALFVQARGNVIRDLIFDFDTDGYNGKDLTIFATHLFLNYTISDWCYQKVPNSIVWAVRDDGKVVALTYLPDHEIWGWHRHDFPRGTAENCASIPEGEEDYVYFVVKRTIDGRAVRYVERMNTRTLDDIKDIILLDSALTYDGRNTNTSHTMTLSGGTNWTFTETLTLTSSTAYFSSSDVGNRIDLTGSDGSLIRFTITGYSSTTVVNGMPHATVPASLQSTSTSSWTKAVDEISGLWHLEGETVAVFADAAVVANPNNTEIKTEYTVADGMITLDQPYGVIHVGIPYISDLEPLDIDTSQGESLVDDYKNISRVSMHVENTRGVWVGNGSELDDSTNIVKGLTEIKIRDQELPGSPPDLKTDVIDVNIQPEWNSNGRVRVRQIDPVPMTILGIYPTGLIPYRRS